MLRNEVVKTERHSRGEIQVSMKGIQIHPRPRATVIEEITPRAPKEVFDFQSNCYSSGEQGI